MHRLYPARPADEVDAHHAVIRSREPLNGCPWLMLNMVASIDGAAAVDGLSGGLSGPADMQMFAELRGAADVILVGAGTANSERYRPPRRSSARLAIVSGSGSIDPSLPLFAARRTGANTQVPLIVTTAEAGPAVEAGLAGRAEVFEAGTDTVDLNAALMHLAEQGARVVLCEGGPQLNASLLAADLVDEINLTIAPLAIGGSAPRIAGSASGHPDTVSPRGFDVDQVMADGDVLFMRWIRSRRRS
ncbi:dihydrofolate reductase family protein [Candidatus Poriferisodalis sp.]|uniref:dihydrofolate reductase family protein n=1 Tax=Candidatus Poriferisodalis sp. TaxID=3101277 RepID=UPI003D0A9107